MADNGWRYTWEAQSHIPTLRLMLFPKNLNLNPSLHCHNLNVNLHSSLSLLTLASSSFSLRVPLPRVLVDPDSPVTFRQLSDHIEVKLLLLLPVDHPALSALNLPQIPQPDVPVPLHMESDVKKLSSQGEVDFYCGSCEFQLTKKPLKNFIEMPSVNWREVADNWFGACCCSFGGISEKLVMRYVNSYTCAPGICLLSPTSVTLCKDDLKLECMFPQWCDKCSSIADNPGSDDVSKGTRNSGLNRERASTCSDAGDVTDAFDEKSRPAHPENEKLSVNFGCEVSESKPDCGDFSRPRLDSNGTEDVAKAHICCEHMTSILGDENSEHHHVSGTARKEWMPTENMEILANQKSFLNGFLEDVFMARSSNLSKDIDWHEFTCPECTTFLGAYPLFEDHGHHTPVDGGVRLFKCYIATSLPAKVSGDVFSKYTMDRMFAHQLMEYANDESSFRFVIRDLTTKSPVLQIVLLNPDTWSCSGNCSSTEVKDPVPKLQLKPVIKVLFSDCSAAPESQSRMMEEWATKNSAENIFMLTDNIQELVESLMSAKDVYPPSCASLQGLTLSSLQRQ